ncbi:MAG: hypothetical protein ACO1PN_06275 [Betaproteobacteria bacterium]
MPVVMTLLLGACAHQQELAVRPPPPELVMEIETPPATPEEVEQEIDRMAHVPGDHSLPAPGGTVEQIDCKTGTEDLHARMAVEARGGQVMSFAYYSKWRPRTCSVHMQRNDPATRWRRTADGATRVQSPHGTFLIRELSGSFEFEFIDVERQPFCGMDGHTNGRMIIKRHSPVPQCSVAGLLDRADSSPVLVRSMENAYK